MAVSTPRAAVRQQAPPPAAIGKRIALPGPLSERAVEAQQDDVSLTTNTFLH